MNLIENLILKLRNKIVIDKNNSFDVGKNTKIRNCEIKIRGKNNILSLDDGVNLNGVNIEIRGEGCKIKIGENTVVGKNTYISAREKNISLVIGKNCMLSRNIRLMTSDGHSILKAGKRVNNALGISIGDRVWIADNVTVMKGVYISEGSIVGMNSTVTKSFDEKNILIGGYPAIKLKEDVSWIDEIL